MSERRRALRSTGQLSRAFADRNAGAGQFNIQEARCTYQEQLDLFENVNGSPYYFYTVGDFPIDEEQRPRMLFSTVEIFFSTVRFEASLFLERQRSLQ